MREPSATILNVPSAEQMLLVGRAIGDSLAAVEQPAFIIALEGELGAGKTTLVGGILRAHGITGPIRSPTYTLIEPYDVGSGRQVYHMDLYRLVDPEEVEPLGLRDLLVDSAVLLIEWPSKAAGALPPIDLVIRIDYVENEPGSSSAETGRRVQLNPQSPAGHKAVQQIVAAIPELRLLSP